MIWIGRPTSGPLLTMKSRLSGKTSQSSLLEKSYSPENNDTNSPRTVKSGRARTDAA